MSEPGKRAPAFSGACPLPISDYPTVQLAHGGGGRLSKILIEQMFGAAFSNPVLDQYHDGAILEATPGRLAFSTDSFVIRPLFFPGGNIGSLAVHGTLNDVAMCGARPRAMSAGFILEEGFPMADLWRIVEAMRDAAAEAGVPIVTGDTKVVDRGKGDGVYINTSGLGVIPEGVDISSSRVRPGDRVLLSGRIAEHGIAIMSVREGLEFETRLESDSASVVPLVDALLGRFVEETRVLRDPTRGGVASALNEIAGQARLGIEIEEGAVPLAEEVRGACEILGFDPLYVANEGKCLAIVSPEVAEEVVGMWRSQPLGADAAVIGEVVETHPGRVFLRSSIGGMRVVDMLSGEQLPRIC